MELPACIGRIETRCCNECRNCDSFCRCIHMAIEKAVVREVYKCQECTGGCGQEWGDDLGHGSSVTLISDTDSNGSSAPSG